MTTPFSRDACPSTAPGLNEAEASAAAAVLSGPLLHRTLQRVASAFSRRIATDKDRYLAQSVDHDDFANRIHASEAHDIRVRDLPPVR